MPNQSDPFRRSLLNEAVTSVREHLPREHFAKFGFGADLGTARRSSPYPCTLSGVELDGDSIVRLVCLDESGISVNESITVVAGVIVDPDR